MKPLKLIDELILQDIREHPGTTQGQVITRLSKYYRSRTYIQTTINRLVSIGMIRDDRTDKAAHLTCD